MISCYWMFPGGLNILPACKLLTKVTVADEFRARRGGHGVRTVLPSRVIGLSRTIVPVAVSKRLRWRENFAFDLDAAVVTFFVTAFTTRK
jgi:hypothetical protein